MPNPVSTSVNKPNVASLVGVVMPFVIWALNRFVLSVPLTDTEVMTITSAVTGAALWVGVYFTTNNPKQPGDNPP